MDEKWGKLDNILSELWKFFVPPILNTVILLVVFPNIPRYIWEGISYAIKTIQDTASSGLTLGDFEKIIENINKIASITDIFGLISSSAISAIITIAILIFVLHKTVLLLSKLIFGEIEVRIEHIGEHRKLRNLVEKVDLYLPASLQNEETYRKWEYAVDINDSHEELNAYKEKRRHVSAQTKAYKEYAMYSIMYSLMAILSLLIMLFPDQKFSISPILTFIITSVAFLYFAIKYLESYTGLMSLDMKLFVHMEQRSSKEASDESQREYVEHGFKYYLTLFDNHLLIKIKKLLNGLKHFSDDRKFMKKET